MEEFIIASLGFPTIIWSFLLCLVAFYWLLTLVGVFDLDAFDADLDVDVDLDGSTEGLKWSHRLYADLWPHRRTCDCCLQLHYSDWLAQLLLC